MLDSADEKGYFLRACMLEQGGVNDAMRG